MGLLDNLLAYYKLQGNSNDEVSAQNGTDYSPTYSTGNGKIGQGAGFPGGNDSKGIALPIHLNGDFTINLWVKIPSFNATRWIVSYWASPYALLVYSNASGNKISVQMNGSGDFPTGSLSNDTWYMLTLKRVGSTGYVYVNATLANSLSGLSSIGTVTQNLRIGNSSEGTNAGDQFYGALDEIGVWERGISDSEISDLYAGGSALQYPFGSTPANNSKMFL